jgi:high-affinity iron transporter
VVAVILGYGIYRGGVRINLSKFFRVTGLVLVLVAAGLVVNALHTAHEAGWLNSGQGATVDLTWLVRPGSVQSSLLTGMLGVQTHPVVIEVIGWLVYLVPVGVYVAWPPGRTISRAVLVRTLGAVAVVGALLAGGLALSTPSRPGSAPLSAGSLSASVVSRSPDALVVRTQAQSPAGGSAGAISAISLTSSGPARHGGIDTDAYTATVAGSAGAGQPRTLTVDRIAALNGGRLPIGLQVGTGAGLPVSYTDRSTLTVWVHPATGRIVDLSWTERVTAAVVAPGIGRLALPQPVATATSAVPATVSQAAVTAAVHAGDQLVTRRARLGWAVFCAVIAGLALLALLGFSLRRRAPVPAGVTQPTETKTLVVS